MGQLSSVARAHLANLTHHGDLLDGIAEQAFVDIDSLLRPVYGHAKQGASYGHAKIAGRSLLRKGLSPFVSAISTPTAAPVVAGTRLRAGKAGSGKAAASMVAEVIRTARGCGATGKILLRGDSAFGTSAVVNTHIDAGVEFSVVLTHNNAVAAAISRIGEEDWQPVDYPGAVLDPDTGTLISDAEVAEIGYTAFIRNNPVTARLVVRRVRDLHIAAWGTTPTSQSRSATVGRDGSAAGPVRSRCQGPLPTVKVDQRDHPAAPKVDG